MINNVIELERYLQAIPAQLKAFPEEGMVTPRSIGKWSNLQILGHLCDSAINNLRRIIEAQTAQEPYLITTYNQDKWVEAQHYANASIDEVIALWESLNRAMLRVLTALPAESLTSREIKLTNGEQHTLEWLVIDYVEHLKHHLKQISPELVDETD